MADHGHGHGGDHGHDGHGHGSESFDPFEEAKAVFSWDMVYESAVLNPEHLEELHESLAEFGLGVGFGAFLEPFKGGGGGGGGHGHGGDHGGGHH